MATDEKNPDKEGWEICQEQGRWNYGAQLVINPYHFCNLECFKSVVNEIKKYLFLFLGLYQITSMFLLSHVLNVTL